MLAVGGGCWRWVGKWVVRKSLLIMQFLGTVYGSTVNGLAESIKTKSSAKNNIC